MEVTRTHAIEASAAACGVAGSFLLALHGQHAAWGWVLFLVSNAGWVLFAVMRQHWFLLLQQVAFTVTSLLGIWRWLI